MEEKRDIKSYFEGVLENINIILDRNFYKDNDKQTLISIRLQIENWYKTYQEKNTLICIQPKELEKFELEITDFLINILKLNQSKRIMLKDCYMILGN